MHAYMHTYRAQILLDKFDTQSYTAFIFLMATNIVCCWKNQLIFPMFEAQMA